MPRITPKPELFSPTSIFYSTFMSVRGISKARTAQIFGVSPVYFTSLLKNKININMDIILNISEAIEITPDILVNLRYINESVKRILSAFPELEKYQKELHEIINENN